MRQLASIGLPVVMYESPVRIRGLLELLGDLFPEAEVVAGREITKLHEEWLRGQPGQLLDGLTERGEFTIVVQTPAPDEGPAASDLDDLLHQALNETSTLRDAVDRVIAATGLPRRTVYERALELRRN